MSEFTTKSSSFTKRRPSKRVKKRSEERPSVSSTSADETTNENSLNTSKETGQNRDDERIDSSGSTESTKHMKSIINKQIQEGR